MKIDKISQYVIHCDYCINSFVYDGWSKKEAIKDAREHEWKLGKKIICPECQDKTPPQKERKR